MSIITFKRKKLFTALKKGYTDRPELLSPIILWDKMVEEFNEVKEKIPEIIEQYENPTILFDYDKLIDIKDEIADLSNICDFLFDSIDIYIGIKSHYDIYNDEKNVE